jgi:hypothetical protein
MDERGVAPVVGKVMEIAVVLLYASLLASALFGGVTPRYEAAAGDAVADRALAAAARGVESAPPAAGHQVDVQVGLDLPPKIAGQAYTVRARNGTLVLDHPHPEIGGERRLAVADGVRVQGNWHSRQAPVVRVNGSVGRYVVTLGGRR